MILGIKFFDSMALWGT